MPDAPQSEEALADAEMALSLAALKYARNARGGRIADPATQLSSYLDRKPMLRHPLLVMNQIAASAAPGEYLEKMHPQHPQFEKLRQQYLARRDGAAHIAVDIPAKGNKLYPARRTRTSPSCASGSAFPRPTAPPTSMTIRSSKP